MITHAKVPGKFDVLCVFLDLLLKVTKALHSTRGDPHVCELCKRPLRIIMRVLQEPYNSFDDARQHQNKTCTGLNF